jgi:hypothetical protein
LVADDGGSGFSVPDFSRTREVDDAGAGLPSSSESEYADKPSIFSFDEMCFYSVRIGAIYSTA